MDRDAFLCLGIHVVYSTELFKVYFKEQEGFNWLVVSMTCFLAVVIFTVDKKGTWPLCKLKR